MRFFNNISITSLLLPFTVFIILILIIFAIPNKAYARYAAIVIESSTGKIVYSRNSNIPRYPASLTKMMTLYLTFDALNEGKLKLTQKLKVSKRAAGQTPSKLGLKVGSRISVENLILAMISKSANDAATVIAESLADSEIIFAQLMTKKAHSLGMRKTIFKNATGLPNRRQKSTAYDIAILSQALINNHSKYYHYFSTNRFKYGGKIFLNHNHLLRSYQGTDGIKTGYIRASGFNVAASAKIDGKRYIAVVFGGRTAKSRDAHVKKLLDRASRKKNIRFSIKPTTKPKEIQNITRIALNEKTAKRKKPLTKKKIPTNNSLLNKNLNWAIQIGAFKKKSDAYTQVVKASRIFPSVLKDSTISISPTNSKGNKLYRARMIKLSKTKARQACNILSTTGIPCNTINVDNSKK